MKKQTRWWTNFDSSKICLNGLTAAVLLLVANTASSNSEDQDFASMGLDQLVQLEIDVNLGSILHSHIHSKGEWMFGYRLMDMPMDGNRDGTDNLSLQDVLAQFPVAPVSMDMESHMLSAMYAPSDDLTVMAMLPFKRLSMDHVTRMGGRFSTKADGIGDLMAMGNKVVYRTAEDRTLVTIRGGLTLPTGSIDERGATPMGPSQKLPYPMQLGSGSIDVMIGINYLHFPSDNWAIGGLASGLIRTGDNDNDYQLGDVFELSGWASRAWNTSFTTTLRLKGRTWGDISGADPELNPAIVPTAVPELRGGTRVEFLVDLEFLVREGNFKGNSLMLSFGKPIHEDLDGPQLKSDYHMMAGWQWKF
jgi:hypothetical protein